MSCEQGVNKFARLAGRISGGIAQLAGKRGFYAGLALAGAGLVGAGVVVAARRRSRGQATRRPRPVPALADARKIPQLSERARIRPLALPDAGERCAGCRTSAGRKAGAWYRLNGRTYCPDCAPGVADKAGIDLVALPAPAPAASLTKPSHQPSGQTTTGQPQPAHLPAERRVETRLVESRVGVYGGPDKVGQPVWFAVNGYVVLRPDGSDTGLALTPALKLIDQGGEVEADTGRWWLTHIPSGKHIPGAGAYDRPEEAHLLASVLAQLDWTRPEAELTSAEIRQVGATVSAFNGALAEHKVGSTRTGSPTELSPRRLSPSEPLTGRLVADGYGGVARVLDDSGERLFVIDSLGERYEVERRQVRTPDAADFEGVRVAMSFDPTSRPGDKCALCNRPTSGTGAGEMWYRMNFKTFCEECARQYASQEAYIMEEEIGDTPEPVH